MPAHNASLYISTWAAPVVESPHVVFALSNVFPLFGSGMRVSCVDVLSLYHTC